MGIDNRSANPSLLIGRAIRVPAYTVPRVLTELQQERADSKGRTRYLRNIEENQGLTWQERRKREFERMQKRRSEDGAA